MELIVDHQGFSIAASSVTSGKQPTATCILLALSLIIFYLCLVRSCFGFGALGICQGVIGAAVLSQHVDVISIVSLFILSCMNMLLGRIFRDSAKCRCSIISWREEAKGVLPTTNLCPAANLDLDRSSSSSSGK